MKEYVFIIVAAFLFGCQFLFQKGFQKNEGSDVMSTFFFSGAVSLISIVYLLIKIGFRPEFSFFSAGLGALSGINALLCTYCGVKALTSANLSVFSLFIMLGGMLLPFVAGIGLFGETLTAGAAISCALIIIALIFEFFAVNTKNEEKKSLKYCVLVFIFNGLAGVFSKTHEYFTEWNVSSESYLIYSNLTAILIVAAFYLIKRRVPRLKEKRSALFCCLYAAATTVGNLLALIALKVLPASLQYPVITGGTIVFSAVFGAVFLKEFPESKMEYASLLTALAAVVVAAF